MLLTAMLLSFPRRNRDSPTTHERAVVSSDSKDIRRISRERPCLKKIDGAL